MKKTADEVVRNPKTKVLYILGWGRSGSTILANILGQVAGFFSVGEINSIWDWGALHDRTCGCGNPFSQCNFWKRVLRRLEEETGGLDAERWSRLGREETRTLHAPGYLFTYGRVPSSASRREFLSVTAKLYETVREISGCPVIVNSSKSPFYGGLLGMIAPLEVTFVHLIRDPRAVAYSWSVQKPQPGAPMRRIGTVESSILWNSWNAAADWVGRRHRSRYSRIRYEDFIRHPRATIEGILRLIQEARNPFRSEASILSGSGRTIPYVETPTVSRRE